MDATTGRAYEDFVPPHNMVTEPATHTLTVDLSAAGTQYTSHFLLFFHVFLPQINQSWSRVLSACLRFFPCVPIIYGRRVLS
jgi:hypothetical protein